MSYLTISEYMEFAWLTTLDTVTSNKVAILMDSVKSVLDNTIWDLSLNQKEEQINYCDIREDVSWCALIECNNVEIKSLDEINWTSYTWVLNNDYQIVKPKKSRLIVWDLSTYLNGLNFRYFNIKYTSWYSVIPNDVKYLQYLLTAWEMAKQWWQEVKSYTLWPRSFTFKDQSSYDIWKNIISNYYITKL